MVEDKFVALRRQAEEALQGQPVNLSNLSAADIQALIHNLQVHQLELEMQNDELRRTHLELQAARDRYADLYNFAPVGYFSLDANGAITEVNLTGAMLLNVTRSALIGAPLTRFVVKEDRDKYAVYRLRLEARMEPQATEVRLIRREDAQFYARLDGLAMPDAEGRLTQCKLTVSDISERVRAEEILLANSRMEATATLAGGLAHDINNLMTSVLGYAELLMFNLGSPKAPDMLDTISQSAQQASDLAQQILAFARGGKNQPKPLNLNNILQQALQLQHEVIPTSLVERQFAPDLWAVIADAAQMSRVMINLLNNALEAGDGQGHIRVSTANQVIAEPADLAHPAEGSRSLKPGKYVTVTVGDTGQGMSAEVLARVFEPFFTTKFQGRGMGLAAVYGIVQNHGGDISIESEAGHGTVVRVYIPAVEV